MIVYFIGLIVIQIGRKRSRKVIPYVLVISAMLMDVITIYKMTGSYRRTLEESYQDLQRYYNPEVYLLRFTMI
jgi:hypothetical protein